MNCANWKDNMHTFQTTRFCLKLSLSGWFPVQCRSFVPVLEKRRRKYKECCVTVANVTRNVIWHALATSFHRERVDVLFRLCHESLFLYTVAVLSALYSVEKRGKMLRMAWGRKTGEVITARFSLVLASLRKIGSLRLHVAGIAQFLWH